MGYELRMRQLGALVATFIVVFVLPFLVAGFISTGRFDSGILPAILGVVWGVLRADVGRGSWPFVIAFGLLGVLLTIWLSAERIGTFTPAGWGIWPDIALTVVLVVAVMRTYRQRRGVSPRSPRPSKPAPLRD